MSGLTRIADDVIAYEEHQVFVLQLHINLIRLWIDWAEDFVSFLREYKAVQEKPDRVVISIDKLRKGLVGVRGQKRQGAEMAYDELRMLASQGQLARFGLRHEHIELFKPILPIKCIGDFQRNDGQANNVQLRDHEIGEVVKGVDIGYGHGNYMWSSCPICGKQEWCRLTKSGIPETWHCTDCGLFRRFRRQRRSKASERSCRGYILVHVTEMDFFYPMANQNGYVLEHRLVMARHLGRCLQPWEIVHHKNGHKSDNHLENLELLASTGEHAANHNMGYIGGYKHGLYDGRNAQVKKLKARIAELEASLPIP